MRREQQRLGPLGPLATGSGMFLTRAQVREVLRARELVARKARGQNFLCEPSFLQEISRVAALAAETAVVEIGPGLGALSERVLQATKNYLLVELDRGFAEYLRENLPGLEPSRLIVKDALSLTGSELAQRLEAEAFFVLSNVPYAISSELLLWLVREREFLSGACLLLQREFALRLAATPGTKAYGALSVLVQVYFAPQLGGVVPGSAFFPEAKVESQVLRLVKLAQPRVAAPDFPAFNRLVRDSFAQRRKTLLNSLAAAERYGNKEEISALLARAAIDPQRRAETLTLEEFAAISAGLEVK